MPAAINIIGQTFGKLKVIAEAESLRLSPRKIIRMSQCECACGKQLIVRNMHLNSGHTQSCGCQRGDTNTQHGHARRNHKGGKSRTYLCWLNMVRRCTEPGATQYKDYGGRGIKVCERWLNSFEAFLEDVGECPPQLTIDRIQNDGHYEPGNVKWSTRLEQNQNRRRDIKLTVRGVSGSLRLVCRHFGIQHYTTVNRRIKLGWNPEEAMFTPPGPSSKRY